LAHHQSELSEEERTKQRERWNKKYATLSQEQKTKRQEQDKQRYQLNREKVLAKCKEYYKFKQDYLKLHPDEQIEALRLRRQKYWDNIEQRRAQTNQYNNSEERKKHRSDYAKKYNQEHLHELTVKRRYHRRNARLKVYQHYSNGTMKCAKCGNNDIDVLSIDHINGGGNAHRKNVVHSHTEEWLVRNNFPDGFQVLCMNCQFKKRVENKEEN
jgi:hypothetical protein